MAAAAIATGAVLLAACTGGGGNGSGGGGTGGSGAPGGGGTSAASPASAAPSTIAQYYAQRLRWRPCHQGFQCARLQVPFDYRRPAWRRFSLPVIRLVAAGPGKRIGSLVINPGGPGGSGIEYALAANQ